MERWQVRHALICVIGKSTYNEQVAFFRSAWIGVRAV